MSNSVSVPQLHAAFLGIGAINYVFTQTLLATHPELQVPK